MIKMVATSSHVAEAAKTLYPEAEVTELPRAMPVQFPTLLKEVKEDRFWFLGPEQLPPAPEHGNLAEQMLDKGVDIIIPFMHHWADPVLYHLGMMCIRRSEQVDRLLNKWESLLPTLSPWAAFNEALYLNPVNFWPAPATWWRKTSRQERGTIATCVIPCYNHEEFLPQAVKSVLDQGPRHYILVVDDGSDNIASALAKFNSKQIYILQHEGNKGLPVARNSGYRATTTNLVCTLDADDLWEQQAVPRMIAAWKPMTWVVGDVYIFGDGHRRVKVKITQSTMRKMQPAHPAILLSRDAWVAAGGYDETIKAFESWDFHIRLLQSGHRVSKVDEICVRYRKRKGQGLLSKILPEKELHLAALRQRNPAFWSDKK